MFEDYEAHELVKLKANAIYVHHGTFSDTQVDENKAFQSTSDAMSVDLSGIKCKAVNGLQL